MDRDVLSMGGGKGRAGAGKRMTVRKRYLKMKRGEGLIFA
jgi:hypothetical protein